MDENEHFEMNYGDELSCKITHYGIESNIKLRIVVRVVNFGASFGPISPPKN